MVEIIQPTKKTNGKRIIDELIWTKETKKIAERIKNGSGKQCKENSDCYVECDDNCAIGEQCTNKRIKKKCGKTWRERSHKMVRNMVCL